MIDVSIHWAVYAAAAGGDGNISVSPAVLLSALGILLGASGIVGWMTVRSTNKSLAVEAADNAVDAVNKALGRIEHELNEAKAEARLLESRLKEQSERHSRELSEAVGLAAEERGRMQLRLEQLQERIRYLEEVVERYRRRSEDRGEPSPPYRGVERRNAGEEQDE